MKWCLFIFLYFLASTSSGTSLKDINCSKQSDCGEGCATQKGNFLCLPTGKIKFRDGENKCRSTIGGLTCGCKEGKCLYALPQVFFEEIQKDRDASCAKEGMPAGGSTLNALPCCTGLTTTNSWQHEHVNEGCNIPPPPGTGGSCVKCGDGKCDSKNFENKCNCPKDCK